MSTIRPIVTALIALSVTFLPLAGGLALAMPHDGGVAVAYADCCPGGKPCEKKTGSLRCKFRLYAEMLWPYGYQCFSSYAAFDDVGHGRGDARFSGLLLAG
jgi:hypothetical protein